MRRQANLKQFLMSFGLTWLAVPLLAVAALPWIVTSGRPTASVLAARQAAGAETRLIAPLHATPDGNVMSGKADYRGSRSSSRLNVHVEGTALDGSYGVAIWRPGDAAAVFQGAIEVAAGGGDLRLDVEGGQAAPVIQAGDVVQVFSLSGMLVVSGNF